MNAYFLPGVEPLRVKETRSGIALQLPKAEPLLIQEVCRKLKARHLQLVKRPVSGIVEAIDRVAARWLKPDDPFRREAERLLPPLTRLPGEMISWGLDRLFSRLRRESLEALLIEEFPDPAVLDRFVSVKEGQSTRAVGPALTVQIMAGNIPGLAVQGLVFSLLVKSPTLMKPAFDEPILAPLFAQSLTDVDPDIASSLAVFPWSGGTVAVEAAAFTEAEAIVAYGDADSLGDIETRIPRHLQFITFGPRLSVGVISREFIDPQTAELAAQDVGRFEMRGCLSPQIFYVEEGGPRSPEVFASLLAERIGRMGSTPPTPEEEGRLRQLRGIYGMRGGKVWESGGFMVAFDPGLDIGPAGGRLVLVKPLRDLLSLPERLFPFRRSLQGIGLAIESQRHPKLIESLTLLGASRICPIGALQDPPLTWHQEGRPRLASRVRWVDLET
ncbi:MAG TPA: acyl-CoA reductase [Nitrospiria bacterium]|nr:acyl-CoA reductase [Nitrospiria bacterium]